MSVLREYRKAPIINVSSETAWEISEVQAAATGEIAANIQTAMRNTARASGEMQSVQNATTQSVTAVNEITGWTARLSDRANDLESKVKEFFARIRAT